MNAKKSQIFLFDLISSLVIIIVTLGIVFSYYTVSSQNVDLYSQNQEIMSSLSQTRVNSLNNEEIRQLFIQSEIRNVDNTVGQQIGEFYARGRLDLARNISESFLDDFVLQQVNFQLLLLNESTVIYLYNETPSNLAFEDSSISSVTRRTIFGFSNSTTLFGPYVFEMRLWQ